VLGSGGDTNPFEGAASVGGLSELELRIMYTIIIVLLVIGLAGASVWLFVIEPRGKIHDRIEP
jgi:hypothetical protein